MNTNTAVPSPLVVQIEKLLKVAIDNNASELRLSGGAAPMLRIDDKLRPLKINKAISAEEVQAMDALPLSPEQKKMFFQTNAERIFRL